MGKRKGKGLKKNHAADLEESPEAVNAPHSFVIHRGLPFANITYLTKDFRRMMEPFTASSLRERRKNKIKDFVSLSGVFHVSHMCIFNKAANQLSFKVARLPKGPTLSFKVHQFTLAADVLSSMKKQYFNDTSFKYSPLVILNNFTGEGQHLKMMATTFQNMFPTINLATVSLSTIKRCVLFSYNPVTKLVDMRHFAVIVKPVGLNRGVKKVILGKVPNLSRCEDIADLVSQEALSDSEYEDDETNQVILPQTLKSKGNLADNKSAVRLYEIGPRMTVELMKIQDDLYKGEILYHNAIVKTEEELAEIKKMREDKKRLKETRRKVQDENVAKKLRAKDNHKAKSLAGIAKKTAGQLIKEQSEEQAVDDDAAYYKEEIGEEPDEELFNQDLVSGGRKRAFVPKSMQHKDTKKRKLNDGKPAQDRKGSFKGKPKSDKKDFKSDRFGKENKSKHDGGRKPKIVKSVKPKNKGRKKAHRNKNK